MIVQTRADGSIHIQDGFVFLRRGLLVLAILFLGLAVMVAATTGQFRSIWGPLAGAVACAALAAVLEDSDFDFDASRREVRWTKRRLSGARGGTIPFADVENVVLEVRTDRSDSGLSTTRDYRVFLVARQATMPLGNSNLDVAMARDAIAVPLLGLLGKSRGALVEESIRYWLSRNDVIQAEAVARSGLGLGPDDVRKLIAGLDSRKR